MKIDLTPKTWPEHVRERFYAKVQKTAGCWWWKGAVSSDGYGSSGTGVRTKNGGTRLVGAHKFSYMLTYNVDFIPRKFDCLHSCDNSLCVNPAHLSVNTRQANIRDCYSKGRGRPGTRPGEPRARLSANQVLEIRRKYASNLYTLGELRREYKVTHKTIADIVQGKSWKNLGNTLTIASI